MKHEASLPWRCYDRSRGRVILRAEAGEGEGGITALWGDPYDWRDGRWLFRELPLERQFSGAGPEIWRGELPLPPRRRLKYGFRFREGGRDWYYSENGREPYTDEAVNRPQNHFFYPYIHDADAPAPPPWAENTVWYQIFPDRFCRAPSPAACPQAPRPPLPPLADWYNDAPTYRNFFGGNLAGIAYKMDYLAGLGITGVYLTPVFQSPSNHKYDTSDYRKVDEAFGDAASLGALTEAAHKRGIKVMLDGVFNHAGEGHPFWQDVLKRQEASPYRDHFHIRRFPVKPGGAGVSEDPSFDSFAYSSRMPKWNTENPDARRYLLDAAAYWVEACGIDAWRLDVANEVSFDFWRAFNRRLRPLKKDFYILGEVWHDASPWLREGLFDGAMNYPLRDALVSCFITRRESPGRFTERLFSCLSRYGDPHNRASFNLLDSHDTPRALTLAGGSIDRLKAAFTMLFLLPGAPCVYYGDEVGLAGGPDPDCRRPMPWDASLQNLGLLAFFQSLTAFRRQYAPILNYGAIRYQASGPSHSWEFSLGSEVLTAAYSETAPVSPPQGTLVFGSPQAGGFHIYRR